MDGLLAMLQVLGLEKSGCSLKVVLRQTVNFDGSNTLGPCPRT